MVDPPVQDPGAESPSRRQFFGILSRAFLGMWGLGIAGVVGAYLKPRSGAEGTERIVQAGSLDALTIGEGRLVRHGTTPFYIVRLDAERVIAMSAVCTHVRCILNYDRERHGFVCPCHAGRFDIGGLVLSGPPNRPLRGYEVSIRAGKIFVQV